MFTSKISIFVTVLFLILLLSLLTIATGSGLTQIELRAKYGQVGTAFNDGKSCYRTCDGRTKTCYYEFHAQYYDTMNSLCGNCTNGKLSDCYNVGCIPVNGVERVIMTINQRLPGPSINVCRGDRIIVDVSNHMPGQGLTIHWHGFRQQKTPFMDGVAMVTQCPIHVGTSFRYAFYAVDYGTYAWHAHSGVHRVNGLTGQLVVREAHDPSQCYYDYDFAEHNILLFDWSNFMGEDNIPGPQSALRLLPSSILINGQGSFNDTTKNKFTYAPMAVFYVQRGRRHRFRIVNTSAHPCPFGITIGGHKLTVIATDAYPIEPIVVDSVGISAGERYDVVMDATCDPKIAETLLTVRGLGVCDSAKIQEFGRIIFVDNIFDYEKKLEHHAPLIKRPSFDSVSLDPPAVVLNYPYSDCKTPGKYCIASAQQMKLPNSIGTNLRNIKPYKVIPLYYDMITVEKRPFVYLNIINSVVIPTVNSIAYMPGPVPGLTQDDTNVRYCNADNLPQTFNVAPNGRPVYHCPHLISLKLDKVYEFILFDNGTSTTLSHPIHVHGDPFQVIDMGTRAQWNSGKSAYANAKHPPVYKDTVCIPTQGFVRIRLRTKNPGYWAFHCHVEEHMRPGMMFLIKIGEKEDMPPPPPNFPTCGNYLMPIF